MVSDRVQGEGVTKRFVWADMIDKFDAKWAVLFRINKIVSIWTLINLRLS